MTDMGDTEKTEMGPGGPLPADEEEARRKAAENGESSGIEDAADMVDSIVNVPEAIGDSIDLIKDGMDFLADLVGWNGDKASTVMPQVADAAPAEELPGNSTEDEQPGERCGNFSSDNIPNSSCSSSKESSGADAADDVGGAANVGTDAPGSVDGVGDVLSGTGDAANAAKDLAGAAAEAGEALGAAGEAAGAAGDILEGAGAVIGGIGDLLGGL